MPLIDKVVGIFRGRGGKGLVDQCIGLGAGRGLTLPAQIAAIGTGGIKHIGDSGHFGLGGVIAAIVIGIGLDGFDHQTAHHPVAAGHGCRLRGQRHQRIHHIGIAHAPYPGMHAAHRIAENQPQMLDPQALCHQPVLGIDHVVVIIGGEVGFEPVRRLGGLSRSQRIRQDDEITLCIKRLALAEQLSAKPFRQHALGRARGAVQDQHSRIFGITHGFIGQFELVDHFACVEFERAGEIGPVFDFGGVDADGVDAKDQSEQEPLMPFGHSRFPSNFF